MTRARALSLAGACALLLLLVPAGAGPADNLQVVDSAGVGAAVGLVTRVPAESPGGAVYSASSITADKALGRAAGFYPGFLVDTFFRTSSPLYSNPSEAVAQHPPGAFPERAETQGGQNGPLGSAARFAAVADGSPSAKATASGARLAPTGAPFGAGQGASSSHSRLLDDGTVVTEVEATARDVVIGTSVSIAEASGRAVVRTPPSGRPTLTLDTGVSGLFVGGVAARLDENGLRVSDRSVVTAEQLAAFNRALASLAASGITVRAAPRATEQAPGTGRVAGAAVEITYSSGANGFEEVVLLGQVAARSVAEAALRTESTDEVVDDVLAASGGDEPATPLGAGLTDAATAPSAATAAAASPAGFGATPAVGGGAPGTEVDPLALLVNRADTRVADRLRMTYGLLVLVAFVAAGVGAAVGRGQGTS